MKPEDIRKMSDSELTKFLSSITQKNNSVCSKCNREVGKGTRVGIYVFKSENRKLCTLCESCYSGLLDYLGVADID